MIHSSRFIAVLDANVLYPAPIRDYLLRLAGLELYKPKWTKEIQDEWIRNLVIDRPDLKRENLVITQDAMNSAFSDANITGYQELIHGLSLPDEKDRHILAAAIRGNADVIVTFNLKDFPTDYVNTYDTEVQHPDEFISNLINLDSGKSESALQNLIRSLRNPPKTRDEVLQTLLKCGLPNVVSMLNE
ncbi:MAG: PIN domain-containing protein [Puia sp.]